MDNDADLLVKTGRKLLFIQKCPQFSQKLSASNACMLATFSMSGGGVFFRHFLPFFIWLLTQDFIEKEFTIKDRG